MIFPTTLKTWKNLSSLFQLPDYQTKLHEIYSNIVNLLKPRIFKFSQYLSLNLNVKEDKEMGFLRKKGRKTGAS